MITRFSNNGKDCRTSRTWRLVAIAICFGIFGVVIMKRETNMIMDLFPDGTRVLSTGEREQHHQQEDDVNIKDGGDSEGLHPPYLNNKPQICHDNPYKDSLLEGHSLITADEKAKGWMANKTNIRNAVYYESHGKWSHSKFNGFEVMAPCHYNCTGPCINDNSKIVCGVDQLKLQDDCIIYSIGGNNNWEFEEYMYDTTPCLIHTFDCTGKIERFQPPRRIRDRHSFHHICLSTQSTPIPTVPQWQGREKWTVYGAMETLQGMQSKLNHTRLDLLKMDIEGFEWPIFDSWPELIDLESSSQVSLPMQILVEIHYNTQMMDLVPQQPDVPFKTEIELINLQEHLLKMGYVVAIRDDNRLCPHCTELTLLRYKCINTNNNNNIDRAADYEAETIAASGRMLQLPMATTVEEGSKQIRRRRRRRRLE